VLNWNGKLFLKNCKFDTILPFHAQNAFVRNQFNWVVLPSNCLSYFAGKNINFLLEVQATHIHNSQKNELFLKFNKNKFIKIQVKEIVSQKY